ncbi:MAG: CsgG/HfaB family protein [Thermodesulfobacteriota bacterium]|nr:CsgG/HfaB family protein [Thermodesulfobacteriota bacterium]
MKGNYTSVKVLQLTALSIVLALLGCAGAPPAADLPPTPEEKMDWSTLPSPPQKKQLVAVAGFENKSTYSADKLWDTSSRILASYLLRAGYFRVVEWEKMKQLFDWDTLSTASLVKTPENMKKAQRILLCEQFLSGSITYFDVRQHASVSATSKKKVIDTTIRVDLLLQDAQSGEYVSAGMGEHTVSQVYSGGLSGGQTGSWDPRAADKALDMAIGKALLELISNFDRLVGHGAS